MTQCRPCRNAGIGAGLISTVIAGCISTVAPPPTTGYGTPYKGNGQPILVSDTPEGWDVKEGGTAITSEQALEATGDPEYEARRQIAKHYNERLYTQGRAHARNGTIMVVIGVATVVAGVVLSSVLANSLRTETTTPATAEMAETRSYDTGALKAEGAGLVLGGAVVAGVGYYLGIRPPPYHEWKTPEVLDRPAYVRQLTEPFNEKFAKPATERHMPGFGANP